MLHETFLRIGREYTIARRAPFASHPLASYIRRDAPSALEAALGDSASGLECVGSPGQGQWAEVPWLAVFDPVVTSSATRGYYVVYLFSADMSKLFLSMNQGTTAVREEFGSSAREVLRDRARLIQARVPEFRHSFSSSAIDLKSSATLPLDYEAGHAFGFGYSLDQLSDEDALSRSFQSICSLYRVLTYRGGLDPSAEVRTSDGDAPANSSIEELRRYRYHRKIERRSRISEKVKQAHGYVCQACGLDFGVAYGERGQGYIEAHHLTPISELPVGIPVSLDATHDFAVLCSNCHRMIHVKKPWLSVAELRQIVLRHATVRPRSYDSGTIASATPA